MSSAVPNFTPVQKGNGNDRIGMGSGGPSDDVKFLGNATVRFQSHSIYILSRTIHSTQQRLAQSAAQCGSGVAACELQPGGPWPNLIVGTNFWQNFRAGHTIQSMYLTGASVELRVRDFGIASEVFCD